MTLRTSVSYNAFHLPRLAGGVGMQTATVIWLIVAMLISFTDYMVMWFVYLGLGLGVQKALAWFFGRDHKLFEVNVLYDQSADFYDIGRNPKSVGFVGMVRPPKIGKDLPC